MIIVIPSDEKQQQLTQPSCWRTTGPFVLYVPIVTS